MLGSDKGHTVALTRTSELIPGLKCHTPRRCAAAPKLWACTCLGNLATRAHSSVGAADKESLNLYGEIPTKILNKWLALEVGASSFS